MGASVYSTHERAEFPSSWTGEGSRLSEWGKNMGGVSGGGRRGLPSRVGLLAGIGLIALFSGCQKERPLKPIIANEKRVSKRALTGTYSYLRSITSVSYL